MEKWIVVLRRRETKKRVAFRIEFFACLWLYNLQKSEKRSNMADGVDIDLYSDDIDQNFTQMKVCKSKFFDYYEF